MAGTIDRATWDRLIALGRERGGLTAGDLQATLPVDAMDVDALVLVMLELEAAGVSVEPDALGPRAEIGDASPVILSAPEPDVPPPGRAALGGTGTAAAPARPAEPHPAPGGETADEGVGRVVLLAGLGVLAILGAILILI